MTATQTFTTAIRVHRSNTGCYEFAGTHTMPFSQAIAYHTNEFPWKLVEPLRGWGGWTHVVQVMYGNESAFYFVR